MRPSRTRLRIAVAALITAGGVGILTTATASADDAVVPSDPVQVDAVPLSDTAAEPAVAACASFAAALDGTATYYGEFADAFEGTSYTDPAVEDTNEIGRTALRQGAGVALDASNIPGLDPAIAAPMRAWSLDATKLLLKMGLRIPGDSLNTTATEMNDDATRTQEACAAAGTHA